MKKVYYLKTCNTCTRILKDIAVTSEFVLQDIKETPITVEQLEQMFALSGTYEALFSKRAKRYKEMGLKDQNLTEKDFRHYILEHYTFLKRPVIIIESSIFVGNSAKTVQEAKTFLKNNI